MPPTGSDTLDDAQAWLRKRVNHGARCPCCTQFAKVYRRKINASMVRALIVIYRASPTEFVYTPALLPQMGGVHHGGDVAKLRYWELVDELAETRPDGGRAGWWRVTDLGAAFVRAEIALPKYALVYDSRCLGLIGDNVTIRDALGEQFHYDDLMRGQ